MAGQLARSAVLVRLDTAEHTCPSGLKSKALLKRRGFAVEDRLLRDREAADAFKREHDVKTTPQVFIGGTRIGGYEALKAHLGLAAPPAGRPTYRPVIAIFAMAFLMALALSWVALGSLAPIPVIEWFIALSMCVLAVQKLRDLEAFSSQFLSYDLLAKRWVPYAYIYPFAEGLAGVLMVAKALTWFAAPLALVIGSIGAISVFKAVYIDRRDLRCACVGGNSNVPLGFVSLTENVMMVAMAVWMLAR
ncbi:MAG: glutaredoxin [Pseudomonadota bacterium]